ncbi:HEAT repeat domain-containing protein [Streptomyces sp. WAC05374]|uniref:HEAT repeat domain-containing protein n=1 Tax=Streptomyces sp. WAC05374 TaxID=2487420 RepID=UPI000F889779|nr:HEAT repeat domain-containing protein [Streptomyces sp. WAC05374]RST11608.1 HEAT repeat domain-containing protein [Streptomyces sp. WAC05374]TDF43042.1 HEAT repeat domain-containing protein [Streptomyces sp. WAC05374]TDF46598.1 HEAT repeat domain-containing protein [Streptomyces sp. WAC05374]TDF53617.1 HEAT repeat domain-containing protein [Streptomyces sp. WAC05374]
MFTGIDEVDWASLGHAYGPADDVPDLLRGLASPDPVEREVALDGMYGAVHHQGDVYDSTLACIPFLLELVAEPEVQDRGCVIELLTSIGGIDLDGDDELEELDPDDEEFEDAANYAMAAAAVAAGADVFLGLVGDDDREVRMAAPGALASLHGDPARVLALLRERLTVETDTEVRLALVEAVGRIALRYESLRDEITDWLGWLMGAAQDPALRLAALAQLARCAPARLPRDVVVTVTGLLDQLRDAPPAAGTVPDTPGDAPGLSGRPDLAGLRETAGRAEPLGLPEPVELPEPAEPRPGAPTLVGQLRELREEQRAGRGTAWADDLLRTLHSALDDRVEDRIALVTAQLRSPDRGRRADAVWMCGGLVRTWRGAYDEVVRLVGAQLTDPEPRLREAAVSWLEGLFEVARPAADALAAKVAADPAPWAPERVGGRSGMGSALLALTRTGDARAVPALARALEQPGVDGRLGYAITHLGRDGAPLVPVLRHKLGGLPLDEELSEEAGPLLLALAHLGAVEALPEVLRVLRGAPAFRREWVVESSLRALSAFGPAAGEAADDLRGLLDDCSVAVATSAARALWAVAGDTGAVLPRLRALLTAPDAAHRREAAWAVGAMGPAGAAAAPELRACLAAPGVWLRVDAAVALSRVTGDVREALPVLVGAWRENRHTRVEIAGCLAGPGPVPAEAASLLRAELARPRRHNVSEGTSGDHDVHHDEKLLALCRRALGRSGEETAG